MNEVNILTGTTDVLTKKKGRKPKQTNYFDVREELAVIKFLETDSAEERNKIYNDFFEGSSG